MRCSFTFCLLLQFAGVLRAFGSLSISDCPSECPEKCPPLKACSETRLDDCGCCQICIRSLNETCGSGIGICADPFICKHANGADKVGRCSVRWPEPCLKAKCDVVFQPKCPEDSRLQVPKSDDECCPKKGICVCDPDKCAFTNCLPGFERVLVVKGTEKPGECCDEYECRAPPKDCERVTCNFPNDNLPCPEDSIRPQSYVPEGGCCPIQPDCRCKPGLCKPVQCPSGFHAVITKKGDGRPGNCCDYFKCVSPDENSIEGAIARKTLKCFDTYNNKTYTEGEKFFRTACIECECHSGIIKCKEMMCPNTKKKCSTMLKKDECCPVCVGCRDEQDGQRAIGEFWQKDECTNCTCNDDFQITCSTPICKTDCLNPRKVPGECCPVCDGPTVIEPPIICPSLEHCPLRCEHGLKKDQRGCFQCKCAEGIEPTVHSDATECEELTEGNCDKQCAHGYVRDQRNCPVCKCAKCPPIETCYKHCLYGFETNSLGCPVCKCRAKSKIDARFKFSSKELLETNEKDKCLSVVDGDQLVERDSGEWWTDGNCRQCFCQQSTEFCSLISCPARPKSCPPDQWRTAKGSCCPSCALDDEDEPSATTALARHGQTVCHSPGDGRLYVDGETWNLADCVSCTCRVGHVLCTATQCPPIPCDDPVPDEENKCCMKCPELNSTLKEPGFCTDNKGIARPIGESWRMDECTSCRCAPGEVVPLCFTEKCATSEEDCRGKPLMIKGKCCPVCSDSLQSEAICSFDNHTFTINEEFKANECRNCTCKARGHLECIELQCPPCDGIEVLVPGQCCPICKDEAVSTEYREGDEAILEETSGLNDIVINLFFVVLVLILFAVICGVIFLVSRKCRKSIKGISALPSPKTKDHVSKIRNTSESESANMSLLSNHSDSSTAPSTNGSSDHGHSETTPLTSQQPRLTGDLV
ncbi:hypothetical protein FO519_002862 [Halicephalobus sp. NKZ332]|nr:hypothetical protein FO519_002862 [Halicephalobus sp. NKZ332]